MSVSLAVKYRPSSWEEVTGQGSTKIILQRQLSTGTFKHAYLFCGPAGCGKTTCARIFAKDINNGKGNPIELDAASNNGVDDVRNIIQQSKTQSLDSEYKIFIIDECHALSNNAWQAMLKIIEEPPAKSIFIFCTTDPQKIPKTILSRVQRYDFQRISQQGIVERLLFICSEELNISCTDAKLDAIQYIAKIADGGMRDAITLLDKCLSYDNELTLNKVVEILGTVNYSEMIKLTDNLVNSRSAELLKQIEELHSNGKDLKQFVNLYLQFILDVNKYIVGCEWSYLNIPRLSENEEALKGWCLQYEKINHLLHTLVKLNSSIKYSSMPKYEIEAALLLEITGGQNDWSATD